MISVVTGSAVLPAPPRTTRGRAFGRSPPPRTSDRLVFLRDSAIKGWLHRTIGKRQAPTLPQARSRRALVRDGSARRLRRPRQGGRAYTRPSHSPPFQDEVLERNYSHAVASQRPGPMSSARSTFGSAT